jgi:hypothetical protein
MVIVAFRLESSAYSPDGIVRLGREIEDPGSGEAFLLEISTGTSMRVILLAGGVQLRRGRRITLNNYVSCRLSGDRQRGRAEFERQFAAIAILGELSGSLYR